MGALLAPRSGAVYFYFLAKCGVPIAMHRNIEMISSAPCKIGTYLAYTSCLTSHNCLSLALGIL